jgi:hypothetical protein
MNGVVCLYAGFSSFNGGKHFWAKHSFTVRLYCYFCVRVILVPLFLIIHNALRSIKPRWDMCFCLQLLRELIIGHGGIGRILLSIPCRSCSGAIVTVNAGAVTGTAEATMAIAIMAPRRMQ